VAESLHKTRFASAFVSQGGLTAIRKWLQPLPDKSLPSLNIRENLLEILFLVSLLSPLSPLFLLFFWDLFLNIFSVCYFIFPFTPLSLLSLNMFLVVALSQRRATTK
jgi:hypothetical protein